MKPLRRAPEERGPRWGLLLFTAFQLLVAIGLPAGDAVLEAASVGTPVHVEAPTDEACGNPHNHALCQLCRVLGLSGLPGTVVPAADLFRSAVVRAPVVASEHVPFGALCAGHLGARAPPRA